MPKDYYNQAAPSFDEERNTSNRFSNGHEMFNDTSHYAPPRSQSGYGAALPNQNPFSNAQQRSNPQPYENGQDFIPTIVNSPAYTQRRGPVIAPIEDIGPNEEEQYDPSFS